MKRPDFAWRDVCDSLRSRPGRALLALISTAIGMLALALMFGVLRGVSERADALTDELGAHSAVLSAQPTDAASPDVRPSLSRATLKILRAARPSVEWSGVQQRVIELKKAGETLRWVRTDERLAAVRGWALRSGRFLDAADVRDGSRHAVITAAAADRWGWQTGDEVGVEDRAYVIVGILESASGGVAIEGVVGTGELAMIVPWTSCPADRRKGALPEALDAVYLRAPDAATAAEVRGAAERMLAAPDIHVSRISWITPDSLIEGLRRWRAGWVGGMGALAALSLILAATSLLGLLMSDVRNRVPEIGLRLALGASPGDIARLFFHEVAMISAVAAVCAVAMAAPLLAQLAQRAAIPLSLDPVTAITVALSSFGFGALCAIVPARMAARISAAEALRNE